VSQSSMFPTALTGVMNGIVADPAVAVDLVYDRLVHLVVFDVLDGVEHVLVVLVHGQRVRPLRQDREQLGVRHEVEPREGLLLLLEVALQALLALLELAEHRRQGVLEQLVGAALHDVPALARLRAKRKWTRGRTAG